MASLHPEPGPGQVLGHHSVMQNFSWSLELMLQGQLIQLKPSPCQTEWHNWEPLNMDTWWLRGE